MEKEKILNSLRETFSTKITTYNPNDENSKKLIQQAIDHGVIEEV